jgi:hypothetical protein
MMAGKESNDCNQGYLICIFSPSFHVCGFLAISANGTATHSYLIIYLEARLMGFVSKINSIFLLQIIEPWRHDHREEHSDTVAQLSPSFNNSYLIKLIGTRWGKYMKDQNRQEISEVL